ncbi:N-acetylmuramoyl-L-alanine amidase [Bacillus sp. B190/17]|uniref:N-acetylmuramoyl-L-alanine amidase n=1 Tax=Bacillus lumedeiriae TaxID=3058829 RepID=A0ABW8IAU6_9BACI
MKRLSIAAVLIACFLSFLLLKMDSQSEQGLLNSLTSEKAEDHIKAKPPELEKKTVSNLEKSKEAETEIPQSTKELEKTENLERVIHTEKEKTEKQEVKPDASAEPPAVQANNKPFLVVIDPGHQEKANLEQEPIGPGAKETKYKVTGGTSGITTKKPEYVLTLEASNLLKAQLEKKGFQVIMTRTSHNVNISNRERAEIANNHNADLFVRIHADGAESAAVSGFSILVPSKENPYTQPIYDKSYTAAQSVLSIVSAEVPLHQNGIFFRSDMSGFNWSRVPVILPEIGFMTNAQEDQKLSDDAYLTNLMTLLAEGIEQYADKAASQ